METKKIIYKVTNIFTNEVYIGATSKSIEERKKDHTQKAYNNTGSYFNSEIRTYGPEAFEWEQIDNSNCNNELAQKEKEYISKFDAQKNGYNRDSGGGFEKEVYQYHPITGNLVARHKNLEEAALAVKASRKSISNACLEYNKSCKGFYWSYDLHPVYKTIDKREKGVMQFSLTGEFITQHKSVAEASKKSGLSKTCIARVCRGEREHSGGYRWKYST